MISKWLQEFIKNQIMHLSRRMGQNSKAGLILASEWAKLKEDIDNFEAENKKLKTQLKQIKDYASISTSREYMWSAVIMGIINGTDFRGEKCN